MQQIQYGAIESSSPSSTSAMQVPTRPSSLSSTPTDNSNTGSANISGSRNRRSSSTNSSTNRRIEHLGKHRQYWRDIILGVNDGLISTFLLVAGVSGSGLTSKDILLTAVSGAVAGAVSMAAGEFVATKSQNDVLQGEIKLERKHIQEHKKEELDEVSQHLQVIGIPPEASELTNQLLRHYDQNSDALLKLMIALEFGVVEEETRSPVAAALVSGGLFFLGSLPSVLPFAVISADAAPHRGLLLATLTTVASLFLVGGIKTWATRGNFWTSAMENLIVAGFGGCLAYFVGKFFDRIVH